MPNFSPPYNPVGLYEPAYMKYIGNWSNAWNTAIYGEPQQTGANVLSNCVGYAQGRMITIYNEITGYDPAQTQTHPFILMNAAPGDWGERARSSGFEIVSEPVEGSVFYTNCHVGVVELYDGSDWWVSESGFRSDAYLYQKSLYKENGNWYSAWANPDKFIFGFIVIPDTEPGPGPGPGPGSGNKYDRRRRYRNNLGGYYGD